MNNNENQWRNWMHTETTQGHFVRPPEKAKPSRNNYTSPVKMRFEWEGKIYEGTAYYVGDVESKSNE